MDNKINPNEETIPSETVDSEVSSSRVALYKCNSKVTDSQRERRFRFLEEQKERRSNFRDEIRKLSDLFVEDESRKPDDNESEDEPQQKPPRPPRDKRFAKKLMQSEYFTDVPEDLAENWYFKVCPEGKRCILVAQGAITKCYWNSGQEFYRFGTNFPGGGHGDNPDTYTILDCVIVGKLRTIFVYDILAWKGISFLLSPAHMRFTWLKSKFDENRSLCRSRNRSKPYTFVHVPWGEADKTAIEEALSTEFEMHNELVRYSGVLFYHKEGLYSTKRTPLVGWLLPCMLVELFNINLIPGMCTPQPPCYENIHSYIEYVIAKKKEKRKKPKDKEMVDVSANGEEEMERELTESGEDAIDDSENANMEVERTYQEAAELEMS